jgi:hypothetical protein
MSRLLGHRPSPAMVVAVLALFIAMAGTSYAAIKLPANSVGSKQIKTNAVVSSKIKDGSLTRKDFAASQLPAGAQGLQGLPGAAGAPGAQGAQGPEGQPAVTFIDVVSSVAGTGAQTATCPAGEIATGGGGDSSDGLVATSRPVINGAGLPIAWTATAKLGTGTAANVTAWAVCVG